MEEEVTKKRVLDYFQKLIDEIKSAILRNQIPSLAITSLDEPHSNKRRKCRAINFPGKTIYETTTFVITIRIIAILIRNLQLDQISTKRNIYYEDVELFGDQLKVNKILDQLAERLGVTLADINVVASPKGQFSGNISIFCKDSTMIESKEKSAVSAPFDAIVVSKIRLESNNQPSLVPVAPILLTRVDKSVKRVIIIEKEAAFKTLSGKVNGSILITGKGYPDEATQRFVYELSKNNPELDFFALVDSDVDGLSIFNTYLNGSEKATNKHLGLGRIEFIGVNLLDNFNDMIKISNRDRKLALKMFQKPWIDDDNRIQIKRELQIGVFLGKKAEININNEESIKKVISYIEEKLI